MDKPHVNKTQVDKLPIEKPRMDQPADVRSWLIEEFATRLAAIVGGITGERAHAEASVAAEPPKAGALCWRQPLSGVPGAMWIVADEQSWRNLGACLIGAAAAPTEAVAGDTAGVAAGVDEPGAKNLKLEYLEIVRQTASGIAQALTEPLGSEFTLAGGEQSDSAGEADWGAVEATLAGKLVRIAVGFEPELLAALAGMASRELTLALETAGEKVIESSKTFDLLLDVELPVSISFGRAQVLLKDVLKLTVGSIVELNRAVGDPVEVIVNNCVIARGEVVVVQGNFGVRIQNVISTQERLRTLD